MSEDRLRLLVPFDGSPAATQAVRLVAAYRGDLSSRFAPVVLNVQPQPVRLWPQPAVDPRVMEEALIENGREVVAPALAMLAAAGYTAESVVVVGVPAPTIVDESRAREPEAIVMGTRGLNPFAAFTMGSVAVRVVHGAACPVALIGHETRLPERFGQGARVLVPVDGSTHAVRACERLVHWQRWLGAVEAQLLYVEEPLTLLEAIAPPHADVLATWSARERDEACRAALAVFAAAGVPHAVHGALGRPAERIAQAADDLRCDFIMMGTRGLAAAHHALVGSVAMRVAAQARVPVVLVA